MKNVTCFKLSIDRSKAPKKMGTLKDVSLFEIFTFPTDGEYGGGIFAKSMVGVGRELGKTKVQVLACEQALLFGQAKRASRECASEGPRKGELATISHKFSFPPRKSRDPAKRENCHRKRAAD